MSMIIHKWRRARKKPVEIKYRDPIPNTRIWIDNMPVDVENVPTLEGTVFAIPEIDYVIEGVEGEFYPIKISVFNKTYDIID